MFTYAELQFEGQCLCPFSQPFCPPHNYPLNTMYYTMNDYQCASDFVNFTFDNTAKYINKLTVTISYYFYKNYCDVLSLFSSENLPQSY